MPTKTNIIICPFISYKDKIIWNLLKRPIEPETIDAWAKWLEDIAKVAIVAVPVVILGQCHSYIKFINSSLLLISCYVALVVARQLRKNKDRFQEER